MCFVPIRGVKFSLSLLIAGIFALFFFVVIVTSLQYERAKRDDRMKQKHGNGELAGAGK